METRRTFTAKTWRVQIPLPTPKFQIMKTRTWIEQPLKSRICGQIAVAIIANITLENAIKLIGRKRNSTRTKDLTYALRSLGYKCPDRCKKMPVHPKLAIGHLDIPKRKSGWHWVVIDGDKIFDGIYGTPDGKVKWEKGWRITSYLPIEESNAL